MSDSLHSRRYQCERCGGSGVQEYGNYWNGNEYIFEPRQICFHCNGEGKLGPIVEPKSQTNTDEIIRLRTEVARLRLTDAEREAVRLGQRLIRETYAERPNSNFVAAAVAIDGLLARHGGDA